MRGGGRFGSDYKRRLAADMAKKKTEKFSSPPPVERQPSTFNRIFEGVKTAARIGEESFYPTYQATGPNPIAFLGSPTFKETGIGKSLARTEIGQRLISSQSMLGEAMGGYEGPVSTVGKAFTEPSAGTVVMAGLTLGEFLPGGRGSRAVRQGAKEIDNDIFRNIDEPAQLDDVLEFGLEGLDEEVKLVVRNKPRLQTLLENNPDRLANLGQLTYDSATRRNIVKVLDASDAFYDIANTGHIGAVSPARFERLSKKAADAIERGQNPLELLLDGKLTPADFNARNGYTVSYKPLNKTEYGAQQTATSYQGSYRMSEITGIPRGSAPRVSDEADLDTRYAEAVESGFVPHRIEVTTPQGTKRTYTPQKEHSIPKSPAGKRLQEYFKQQVASTKDKSVIKQQKAVQRELDAIINARDTFFDLPPYYNRLKADLPTDEFKRILLEGGPVEIRTAKGRAIVNKEPDPDAYERFYGEDSPIAEGLRRRQELLTSRLYDWGRRNDVPIELVDDLIMYL